jgi:dTDP-4-dehydrorhamnose reductase
VTKDGHEKVLVLGASGMLGNAVFRLLADSPACEVVGCVRSPGVLRHFRDDLRARIRSGIDVDNLDTLIRVVAESKPTVIINCIGLVKQLAEANDPLLAIPVNALLPHRLARISQACGARFIHISTDCVFAGTRGNYRESDVPDAQDLYGRSKCLGEVAYPGSITLRTSIIGHELDSANGLVGWFLAQQGSVKGYRRAIFSGLPTVELARVMRDIVIPNRALSGLYHVASKAINKNDLLSLIAREYRKTIEIVPDDAVVLDRSLDARRFAKATGYAPAEWPELVRHMHQFG